MRKFWLTLGVLFMANFVRSETIAVRSHWMIDVDTGTIVENPVILIQQNKITEVGTEASIKIPEGATVIDLTNMYLLPGLIDAHVHLAWAQQGATGVVGSDNAEKTLLAGFTTVRNPGSTGKTDLILRDAIEEGKAIGPRMFVSGPALGAKEGVCDQVFAGEAVVHSPQDAMHIIVNLAKQKVNFIKFCAGGQVIPSDQDISAKELEDSIVQTIVFEARKLGLKVAAHAQGPDAILQAVSAGVNSIEHGGMINEEAATAMKKHKAFLVPTLYRLDWILENAQNTGAKPEVIERLQTARTKVHDNIRMAIAAGVPIAFGTDATVYPHGLNAREFSVLVELGMTPLQAIQSASTAAANLLGWEDKIGRIRPGCFADLIALPSNPLKDVKALENVQFVMKEGKVYRRP
ncbi:amidohydrolase family protein [bacterium]|nr:amidohydrolase family protein [bacterium]MCI0606369.1 amidohydrolase family protein [bacterium]